MMAHPRLLTRSICLYIDPQKVLADPDLRFAEADLQPRLLFEDGGLGKPPSSSSHRSAAPIPAIACMPTPSAAYWPTSCCVSMAQLRARGRFRKLDSRVPKVGPRFEFPVLPVSVPRTAL